MQTFSFIFLLHRIAIFSLTVLRDDRIVVVAEQRPQCSEEEVGTERLLLFFSHFIFFLRGRRETLDRPCRHLTANLKIEKGWDELLVYR